MIAHNPLRGSGRADFPHPALTSGNNAKSAQRIRMKHAHRRQPAVDQAPHSVPSNTTVLTAARQRPMPEPAYLVTEQLQRRAVHGHSVIADVSTHHRAQPLACLRNGSVHAPLQFGFHLAQLRLQPFTNRLPQHRVVTVAPLLPADMREAQEVERLRLSLSALLPVLDRIRPELQKARLLRMQFEAELSHSFAQFCPEPFGIRLLLESNHDVVGIPHDDHIAMRLLSTPCLDPQIKGVMKIDIRQQRRCTAALGGTFLHSDSFPILQHARVQPFLDEPHDAPVCNAVLDELHQPFVRDRIEGSYDTLPIIMTFSIESLSSVLVIRLREGRLSCFGRCIARGDCISS